MNRNREKISARVLIIPVAVVAAFCVSGAVHAERIRLEPDNARGAVAAKAQTIINKSGSYVLSKNIVVTKSGIDALDITASNVTLDLQGYTILGNSNANNGINASGQSNVVILDGIVTGFGGAAIIAGTASNISGITATNNGSGITCGIGCLVQNNIIQGNGPGAGIIFSDPTGGYVENVMQGNSGNTVGTSGQVTEGTTLGHNLCNGVAC